MYLITDNTPHTANMPHSAPKPERQSAPCGASDALALNWLEGHLRIMGFWIERLVSENGDAALIDTLHHQSKWLEQMTQRLGTDP